MKLGQIINTLKSKNNLRVHLRKYEDHWFGGKRISIYLTLIAFAAAAVQSTPHLATIFWMPMLLFLMFIARWFAHIEGHLDIRHRKDDMKFILVQGGIDQATATKAAEILSENL